MGNKNHSSKKTVFTSSDLAKSNESLPGYFPYTRGIRETMYTHKPWTIRQYAGFSTAKESNAFYKDCLAQGQKGLSVAFDLPTHRGYDSDNPLVLSDVGKAGVAIDSVEDMHELFEGISLKEVSVSMTMNGAVLPILAAYFVVAKEQGANLEEVSGTIQNDILKEFMVRNTYIYPPKPSMRIVADIMEYTAKHAPLFNSISVSGYHIHEAGASLELELALTILDGLEYVKNALERKLDIDNFAPRISFFFATGMSFFHEIAKLRAARRIWAESIKGLGAKNPKSMLLRTHCQTSGWSLAAKDPYNNIMRTTIEALASVLGGTQSLHTNSFDEALSLPSKFSAKLARNTQLILQHETGLCDVVDPLGGSYYLEHLTESLEKDARAIMAKINQSGGMLKAIEQGLPMRWIEEKALLRQAALDSKEEVKVGVNAYISKENDIVESLFINNEEVVKAQKQKLAALKQTRDARKVKKALEDLIEGAKSNKNLLDLSINAMETRATVGEVSDALSTVFSRYTQSLGVSVGIYKMNYKDNAELSEIQNLVIMLAESMGRQPRMLVAKLGQDGHDRGAKVIASAFSDLGFDVDISPLFQTPKVIAKQAVENDVHVIGVSTLAAGHNTLVPSLIEELKELNARDILVVVGGVVPEKDHATLTKNGVTAIFSPGDRVLDCALRIILEIAKNENIELKK